MDRSARIARTLVWLAASALFLPQVPLSACSCRAPSAPSRRWSAPPAPEANSCCAHAERVAEVSSCCAGSVVSSDHGSCHCGDHCRCGRSPEPNPAPTALADHCQTVRALPLLDAPPEAARHRALEPIAAYEPGVRSGVGTDICAAFCRFLL